MIGPVLITGGFGYLGSRLARSLLREQCEIRLGTRDIRRHLPETLAGCRPVHTDYASTASLRRACEGVRQIIHLAAMNDADCTKNPENAFESNVIGTLRLLEASRISDVERVLYLSTAHVYRSPLAGTLSEETVPRPAHAYGITHRAAEDIVLANKAGAMGIVIRLANAFGAPVHPDVNCWMLLVNDLCRQAVTAGELTLKSTGMQQRNFVTLNDFSRAIVHFLNLPTEKLGNRIFNIGARSSITVLEMTEMVAERCGMVMGFRPSIYRAAGDDVLEALHFDVRRAEQTGFIPVDDYAAEIDDCLKFCREAFNQNG